VSDRYLTAAAALLAAHPGRRWPCCEWVARIVRDALGLTQPDGGPWWRAMNVWSPADPWSAPWAMDQIRPAEVDYEQSNPTTLIPGRWYVVQGWRRLSGPGGTVRTGDSGHTWLWYATSPTHGVVLDSSTMRGPRLGGVAYTGQALPEGRPWTERIAAYPAGVAVALLPE
jgi:hypothetical protein